MLLFILDIENAQEILDDLVDESRPSPILNPPRALRI
jgi:hypothetical protein